MLQEQTTYEQRSAGFGHLFERVRRGEVAAETAAHLLGVSRREMESILREYTRHIEDDDAQ